jgi:D-serine deaminase-like pyridoxal phosphate-dependent protein
VSFDGIDTPALLVDLEAADRNIQRQLGHFAGSAVRVRPHLKTVKSPVFARRLLDAGASGVCVAKLAEAEVMAAAGIDDILLTTELVGARKLERLVALLRASPLTLTLVVDGAVAVDALADVLDAAGLRVPVLIDLDVGQHRTGVLPGAPALALARHVASRPALLLAGVQGYEGHLQHVLDAAERERACRAAMATLVECADALRADGHDIRTVTTGGTGTALFCKSCPGVTEVQPGSFVFMDVAYRRVLGDAYEPALTLLSTVISRPRVNEAVVDAGLKSLSTDMGVAEPLDRPGVSYRPAGDEHGILSWDATAVENGPQVGEQIRFIPSHIDTTVNLHDGYHIVRNGACNTYWPVAARGKVQ